MSNLKVKSSGINFNVPTINDFPTEHLEDDLVCVVTDENRGGVFVYRSDNALVNNGGTIFDGWTRQYDGAVNVKWFGAKGDGVTDDTVAIQNALNIAKNVSLVAGETYLASNINAVLGGSLACAGGRATIKMKSGLADYGVVIQTSGFTLDGINIDGGSTTAYNVESPVSGQRVGLVIGNIFGTGSQLQNITVKNCEIYGCSYAGLLGREVQIGFVFGHRVTLHNVNCHHNYVNMWFDTRFEYVNATLCYGYNGYIGVIVAGGNNKFSACSFENNWQNCQLATGENNAHGGFTNCSFNHAITGGLGLYALNVTNGMSFTNCFFWYAPITISTSVGIQIRNSEIVSSAITINSGGVNSIDDNFIKNPIAPTFIGYTFTTFRRNRVLHTDTSLVPIYGDIFAEAIASSYGALPLNVSTNGASVNLRPIFSVKKWHGVDAPWMQSTYNLVIGSTRMVQIDYLVTANMPAVDEMITLTVVRYNSLDVQQETFSNSSSFKASQVGASISLSTRMLCVANDKLGFFITTQTASNISCTKITARVSSID